MGVRRCIAPIIALASIIVGCNATPAGAHGFGQRYDLPIPLSFYLWGAGAAVAFSFVIFAFFLTAERAVRPLPSRACATKGGAYTAGIAVAAILRAASVVLFVLVVIAGFLGDQNPIKNPAPAMIWIIGWVGLSFASALFGNVWQVLNPWDTLFRLAERTFRAVVQREGGARPYPEWLGVWLAFLLFIGFAWMELVWPGRDVPAQLAAALVIYSMITWTGMAVVGRATWLARGEVFAIVFGVFARFAPLAWPQKRGWPRERGRPHKPGDALELRLPASGLLEDQPLHPSMVALVIALLATVTFDGFLETPLWARLDVAILNAPLESPLWTTFNLREEEALRWARTLALPCFVLVFLAGYLLVCRWMSALTRDPPLGAGPALSAGMLARRFVLSLVPISLAYHVAHYFSYLLVDGQYVIPILSDPFGLGWNLFGTASYQVDIGLVDPRLQWSVAVVVVVLGHIIAVYLAHVTALRLFRETRAALISQIPMVLLMVGYTMCSLWILSQPIVETTG
jgi:hypothetical protein